MNLEPKMREQVRLCLLRYLDAATPGALATSLLKQMLHGEGYALEKEGVFAELSYLRDKGFVANPAKSISPEVVTWSITAAGRDTYAQLANE
jgi:hypothetical protein